MDVRIPIFLAVGGVLFAGGLFSAGFLGKPAETGASISSPATVAEPLSTNRLVRAARAQVGVTLSYSPAYANIAFPNGDVPRDRGVCTDVVIRAYRDAFGYDLQSMVHRDMSAHFELYPKIWGLRRPDTNIDHRRVPNLQVFFTRKGTSLPVSRASAAFQPGDLVTSMLPGNLPHIMIVSDRLAWDGRTPLVIHNVGGGTREENVLFDYPITGHYRLKAG